MRMEFPPHLDFHKIFELVTKSQSLENHMYFRMYLLKLIYDHCVIHPSVQKINSLSGKKQSSDEITASYGSLNALALVCWFPKYRAVWGDD